MPKPSTTPGPAGSRSSPGAPRSWSGPDRSGCWPTPSHAPARPRTRAGTGFAGRGDAATAAPLLGQALDTYERLDAAHDAARAEATLRELGIRRGRRGPRRRPQLGWDSLTPTEHRVVELVAAGLSNPQIGGRLFVSRRTVQTHLAHVFTKLGISSRIQLAAETARRLEPPENV